MFVEGFLVSGLEILEYEWSDATDKWLNPQIIM